MSESLLDSREISEAEFSTTGSPEEKLRFLLHYAVLAPSRDNTQPWLFRIRESEVELHADRTRAMPVVDSEDRELIMSCGAALFHLRIAMRHFGYQDEVRVLSDPDDQDLLACVRLGAPKEATEEEHALFRAILKRRTNRLPFEDRQVAQSLLSLLQAAAAEEGAWFHVVQGDEKRNALADLIAEGDRVQWADKRARRELVAWIHPNRSKSRDGIPGYAHGLGEFLSCAGPLVLRTFDLGKGLAAEDRHIALGSPVLAVLGTDADTPKEWLCGGQALARLLLRARAENIWASFLNQPIEVAELRPRLQELLGRNGFPQLLLRMGYGQDVKPTPRRKVDDILH